MKNTKKKGFTLIELIVVIAILGILAAIAVPRMAGFTDKSKIAADVQYGKMVANATQTIIADGNLTRTETVAGTVDPIVITFNVSTGVPTLTSGVAYKAKFDGTNNYSNTYYQADMQKLVAAHAPAYYLTTYTVTIDANDVATTDGTK